MNTQAEFHVFQTSALNASKWSALAPLPRTESAQCPLDNRRGKVKVKVKVRVKVKSSLCSTLTEHHAMKAYWGAEV
jgi:hypothetical protein